VPHSTEWVEPALFLMHQEVAVYHMYKDGDTAQGPRAYAFTLNDLCGEDECVCEGQKVCKNVFEVHDLATWQAPPHPPYLIGEDNTPENQKAWEKHQKDRVECKAIETAIKLAIEQGILTKDGAAAAALAKPD